MRIVLVLLGFLLILISACSNERERNEINTVYESEGEQWRVSINNKVFEKSGKSYFTIKYTYKGELEQLHQVEKITFSQGTVLATQLKNVYDPAYKERLVKEGQFEEEKTEQQMLT